ncbi:MAG: fibronectin type III domain-containing protein [Sulfolobus sp.]|nr:fibronectin type III domain-containing protein [Sulfolobus sp.]
MRKLLVSMFLLLLLIPLIYLPRFYGDTVIIQAQSSIIGTIPNFLSSAVAVVLNGSIYLIGGNSPQGYSTNVYVYSNGSWHLGPELPFPLVGASAVVYNGTIYVVGGLTGITQISSAILELKNNHWIILSNNMPEPVYDAIVTAYDNKIYVIGGINGTLIYSAYGITNAIQVFYLNNNSWGIVGKFPIPISDAGYVTVNNSVLYIFGGYSGYYGYSNTLFAFYPQNNSIVNITAFQYRGTPAAVGYYKGAFFSIGGNFWITSNEFNNTNQIFVYYNGSWRTLYAKEAYPTFSSAYVQIGNTIYIMGGRSQLQMNNQINLFQEVVVNVSVIKPKVIKHYPPPPPYNVMAKASNNSVYLTWQDVNASGYYVIYWSSILNGKVINISVGNVTSYNITGLKDGITYFFEVQAYNQYGLSNVSAVVSATPYSVPLEPEIINVIPGNRNLTVIWEPPNFTGGFPILGYYLGYKKSNSSNITWLNVGNVTQYTITDLMPGVEYYVYVIAYNKWGNSTYVYSFGIPAEISRIKVNVIKEYNGLNISWSSSYEANYTLVIVNGSQVLLNKSLGSDIYNYFVKLPFGNYTIEVIGSNPAGTYVSKIFVVYYLQPSTPKVSFFLYNNTLTIYWNKVSHAFYYVVEINGYKYVTTNTSFVYKLPGSGTVKVVVMSYNPAGYSSPYIATINSPSVSVSVQKITVNVVKAYTNITKVSIVSQVFKVVKEHDSMYYFAVIGLFIFMVITSVVILFYHSSSSEEF